MSARAANHYVSGVSYVLAGDCMDNVIWRSPQKFCDDRKLVDMVLSREQRLALQHFCEDTASTPDINLNVIFLPCEHNLRGSVVSRRYISGHLRILNPRKTKIADFQVAVLIYQNVARL